MNVIWKCVIFLIFLSLFSCSEQQNSTTANSFEHTTPQDQQNKTKYLAYIHNLNVALESDLVAQTHKEIVDTCNKDITYKCVILNANLSTSNYYSSKITLKVMPAGVGIFSNLASQAGSISSSSSTAEDLGDQIVDSQKRIEMLEAYRKKLEILESKPNDDIDTLIKIASELSKVQNEIEYANGKSLKLIDRAEMDMLNISLYSNNGKTFFGPISDSLSDFGSEFSYGISSVISSAAYIIPWIIFLVILLSILRIAYKKLFRK